MTLRPFLRPAVLAPVAAIALLTGCGGTSSSSSTATSPSVASADSTTGSTTAAPASSGSAGSPTDGATSGSASSGGQAGTGTASSAPAASASASASAGSPASGSTTTASAAPVPTPAGPLKSYSSAKLPSKLGSYNGTIAKQSGGIVGMYTGATQDQMLMVSLAPGKSYEAIVSGMSGATTSGHATCGKVSGAEICAIPLQGGSAQLTGSDKTSRNELAGLANSLWGQFA